MDDILTKSPRKTPKSGQTVGQQFAHLASEPIIGEPSDLAKLFFTLENGIDHWPQDLSDPSQYVIKKLIQIFDYSGEEATKLSFNIALEYGFIELKIDENEHKSYQLKDKTELNLSHDCFCFLCDRLISKTNPQFLKCKKCLRIYHKKCLMEFEAAEDYVCEFCVRKESETFVNEKQKSSMDPTRVNRILNFLLVFIKNQMKEKIEKLDFNTDDLFVFNEINLKKIESKVDRKEYTKISEFDDDFMYFMHNMHITQIHALELYKHFADCRCFMNKEYREIQKCVDCYERSNDNKLHEDNKDWFCLPCDPPHDLRFVKIKGQSLYPAKVLVWEKDNKKVEVRFFDNQLQKMEVSPKNLRNIRDEDIRRGLAKNQKMVRPLEMLLKYEELMREKEQNGSESTPISSQDSTSTSSSSSMAKNSKSKALTAKQCYDRLIETTIDSVLKIPSTSAQKPHRLNKKIKTSERKKISNIECVIESVVKNKSQKSKIQTSVKKGRKKKSFDSEKVVNECDSPTIPELGSITTEEEIEPTLDSPDPPVLEVQTLTPIDEQKSVKRRSQRVSEKKKRNIIVSSNTNTVQELSLTPEKTLDQLEQLDRVFEEDMETDTKQPIKEQKIEAMNRTQVNDSEAVIESQTMPSIASNSKTSVNSPQMDVIEAHCSKSSPEAKPDSNPLINNQKSDTEESNQKPVYTVKDVTITYDMRQYNEAANRFEDIVQQIESMKGPIPKDDLDEKMAVLKVRHNKQIEALNELMKKMETKLKEVQFENFEAKCKTWCAVCHKLAEYHCCYRFYCSEECQQLDWTRGHGLKCLAAEK